MTREPTSTIPMRHRVASVSKPTKRSSSGGGASKGHVNTTTSPSAKLKQKHGLLKKRVKPLEPTELEVESKKYPRSVVARSGDVERNVKLLVGELRKMLLPYTAFKLNESKHAKLENYLSASAAASLTHLMILRQNGKNLWMTCCQPQRGVKHPEKLKFRVLKYSLVGDVRMMGGRNSSMVPNYHAPAVLVMHGMQKSGTYKNEREKTNVEKIKDFFSGLFAAVTSDEPQLNGEVNRIVVVAYTSPSGTPSSGETGVCATCSEPCGGACTGVGGVVEVRQFVASAERDGKASYFAHTRKRFWEKNKDDAEQEGDDDDDATSSGKANEKTQIRDKLHIFEVGPRMTLQLLGPA